MKFRQIGSPVNTDSYKPSHHRMSNPDHVAVYSFFTSRGCRYPDITDILFFGTNHVLRKHFIQPVTHEQVTAAATFWDAHVAPGIFPVAGWRRIVDVHGGRLPLRIQAVKEGTILPQHNVLLTIENTDHVRELAFLPNWMETVLSHIWYPTTVATLGLHAKRIILKNLTYSGSPETIAFRWHDFGYRGSTTQEAAAIGGAAHLVNFMGTDTTAAFGVLEDDYEVDLLGHMPGFSIPATEHSVVTSWGRSNELKMYRNLLEEFPTGLIACVSDSYDVFNACREFWGGALRDKILERDGCLVVRPDSGEPSEVVPQMLTILLNAFAAKSSVNAKGFQVLPPQIRTIQGDGIDCHSIQPIYDAMHRLHQSSDNISFGSGAGTLQKMDRDTFKMALKQSAGLTTAGVWEDVYKEPITDRTKSSRRGRLQLYKDTHGYFTARESSGDDYGRGYLDTVFLNGFVVNTSGTFDDIRQRATEGV